MAVVGDRILTDVVFANRVKMRSILVAPLDPSKDNAAVVRFKLSIFFLIFSFSHFLI